MEKEGIGEIHNINITEEPPVSTISIPRIREPRDFVYSGTIDSPLDRNAAAYKAASSPNKKTHKKKISPFSIILILFVSAIISVLYIGNILAVSRLLNQINKLQTNHQQIVNQQEILKAQIIKLSNLERIQQIAQTQLGLERTKQLPVWIEIDHDQVNQVDEIVQQMENKQ